LSVVVPFYNVEDYLEACLESLERQTLHDLEVIMVDDGSLDGSGAIAKAFSVRDARFRLIVQPNQGLGPARNSGARHATGEFLAFADGDDVIPRYAYELMVGSLRETGSDLACGGVRRIGANGFEQSPMHQHLFKVTRKKTHVREFPELLDDRTAWNKVFRRSFWDRHAFEFPPGLYEDAPVTIPAHALAGTVDVLREPVYHWRVREAGARSITQRRTEPGNLADRIRSIRSAADSLARHAPDLKEHYDRLALQGDIIIFVNVLDQGDDAYRETFFDLVNGYLDQVDERLFSELKSLTRLKLHAVRRRMLPELVELVSFGKTTGAQRGAAIRRSGLLRTKWYADYPFLGDPRFPDQLYELGDELDLKTGISRISWHDGRLRIEGHAYIERLDAPKPDDIRVHVELRRGKGSRRQVIKLATEQVRRPDVTVSTWQATACHDWSGFVAEVDPARLSFRRDTWQVAVKVVTHGVRRSGWLRKPKGEAWWPPVHEVSTGVRLSPKYVEADQLVLAIHPIRAQVTAARVDGDVLELTGWARSQDAACVREGGLVASLRQGVSKVRLPVTTVEGSPDGRIGFQARIPVSELAQETGFAADSEDNQAPSAETESVDWDLSLEGPDKKTVRLAVEADLEGVRAATGGHEYVAVSTRYGNLTITERVPRLVVTEATWQGQAVELFGACADADLRPSRLVLRRHQSSDTHEAALSWDGSHFRAILTTTSGTQPLRSGAWNFFSPNDKGEVSVCVDQAAKNALPAPRTLGVHQQTMKTYRDDHLQLLIAPALTLDEGGKYAQRRLQKHYFSPSHFKSTPLRDVAVFESYFGTQYSCNPRAIYEEMAHRNLDFDYVWGSSDGQFTVPGDDARTVLRGSTEFYETLAAAKVVVNNCLQLDGYVKRSGQLYLQTWHGTPYKHIGYDLVGSGRIGSTTTKMERFVTDVPMWDLFVSPGPHVSGMFRQALRFECEALEVGYPRNDTLLRADNAGRAAEIRARLGIPPGRRVVLYVPTWREDVYLQRGRRAELMLDSAAVATALGDDYAILVRQHHLVADRTDRMGGNVIDVTHYPDITELYLIADAVITDYSSVMFDFAVTGRPLLFFTPDLEYYESELRGTYFSLADEAPGPLLRTSDEVIDALRDLDRITGAYAGAYAAFSHRYCPMDDGRAAARVVDRILAQIS
jgi:CDP-glycerol glycerophosphotransferase